MNTKNLLVLALIVAISGFFASCGKPADSRLTPVAGADLAEKLQWLITNAVDGTGYLLEVKAEHEEIVPHHLSYFGSNISILIRGAGKERTVSFADNGSLFTVNNGVTLMLENITLIGASGNNSALVRVNAGGVLQLNQGAKIAGNNGDGVYNSGGTITMNGGEISGNAGSGVRNDVFYTSIDREYVTIIGTFTMNGGEISGNSTSPSTAGAGVYNNGTFLMSGGEISGNNNNGVHNNGSFTMTGGKISGNISFTFDGGGVHNGIIYTLSDRMYAAVNGTFTMAGGEISGNTSSSGGGVSNYGIFIMENGKISNNTCSIGGGVDNHGTFTLRGGKISGNTAFFYGGGVSNSVNYTYTYEGYVPYVIFTMNGGEISGNTASSYGGGVFVDDGAVFDKTGGTINDYVEGDLNSNVVKNDSGVLQNDQGHAVYIFNDRSDN